jgi:transcriptional regulator with XRE-family HTH domain
VKTPRLRKWRLSHGLTQKELSEQAGVSEFTIIRVENGAEMRPGTARKLANTLGVSVSDLVEDPPIPLAPASARKGPDPAVWGSPEERDEGDIGAPGPGGRRIRKEVVDGAGITDSISIATVKRALQAVERREMTSDEAFAALVAGEL